MTNHSKPFPLNSLPLIIRDAVVAANNKINVPVEGAALVALSLASYAIQGHYDVRPLWDVHGSKSTATSLFALVIIPSGGTKSTMFNLFNSGIRRAIHESKERHDALMIEYRSHYEVWSNRREIIKKDKEFKNDLDRANALTSHDMQEPVKPADPDSMFGNITTAALCQSLLKCSPSAGLFSPEGGELLAGHSMSDKSGATEMSSVLSKLWDADEVRKDTISGGKIQIQDRRFAMCLMAQEEVVADFLANPVLRGQGIHARCLLTKVPQFEKSELSFTNSSQTDAKVNAFNNWTYDLATCSLPVSPDDAYRLTPDVLDWADLVDDHPALAWYNSRVKSLADIDGKGTQGFINRMLEHMCRLAAIIAVADREEKISHHSAQRAIDLTEYFFDQWDNFEVHETDVVADRERTNERKFIKSFKAHKAGGKTDFTYREISKGECANGARLSPAFPRLNAAVLTRLLDQLVAEGRVNKIEGKAANGRKVWVYQYAE